MTYTFTLISMTVAGYQNCGGFSVDPAMNAMAQSSIGAGSDGLTPTTDAALPPLPAGMSAGGVALPPGFTRVISDRFGSGPTSTVQNYAQLHAKYYEGQYYNRNAQGLTNIPNNVINGEQQTYSHFEDAIAFSPDHITIQARGKTDGSITSAEMVSVFTSRSFCVESRYRIPSTDKSWAALWWYGSLDGGDNSEIDIEQPITPNQGVRDVSFHNHPYEYDSINILDSKFTTPYMTWTNSSFDASNGSHLYTTCYDDVAGVITHWVDKNKIYSANWKWNKSMGGTGHGSDPATILNLAVGGVWPGNTNDPTHYRADFDIYYVDYYIPTPAPAAAAIDGAALYSQNCVGCHGGISGMRGTTLAQLNSAISSNTGGMGAFAQLSAPQRQAVVTAINK